MDFKMFSDMLDSYIQNKGMVNKKIQGRKGRRLIRHLKVI